MLHSVAGFAAASVSTTLLYPLDLVKVSAAADKSVDVPQGSVSSGCFCDAAGHMVQAGFDRARRGVAMP